MKYFSYEPKIDMSLQCWNNSQFDLADIVLSLTDNRIFIGAKIYAIFCRPEVLNIMQYFICDFNKIKDDLGICGYYIERDGDIYSTTFNPARNINVLTLSINEMRSNAREVYKNIMTDLNYIAKCSLSK